MTDPWDGKRSGRNAKTACIGPPNPTGPCSSIRPDFHSTVEPGILGPSQQPALLLLLLSLLLLLVTTETTRAPWRPALPPVPRSPPTTHWEPDAPCPSLLPPAPDPAVPAGGDAPAGAVPPHDCGSASPALARTARPRALQSLDARPQDLAASRWLNATSACGLVRVLVNTVQL